MTQRKRKGAAAETGGRTDAGTTGTARETPAPPEPRGFVIEMRPRAAVLLLSLLWWKRRAYMRGLAPGRNYTEDQLPAGLKAIDQLVVARGGRPTRETRGGDGAAPDFEEWADRKVGIGVVDEDLAGILPTWLRGSTPIRAVVDLAPPEWETILGEVAALADRTPADSEDLWNLLTAGNCELGTWGGHVFLFEELLGEILRALREASPRNLVVFDSWAQGLPRQLPFPLWEDVAVMSWVRSLAGPDL